MGGHPQVLGFSPPQIRSQAVIGLNFLAKTFFQTRSHRRIAFAASSLF
jgi:hypothetical protein